MRLRPISPRHEWESLRAVANRMQECVKGGYALIRMDEISNEIEARQIETLANEQIKALLRRARQAEQAANTQYRR